MTREGRDALVAQSSPTRRTRPWPAGQYARNESAARNRGPATTLGYAFAALGELWRPRRGA